jgi:hypothetical protein
MTLPQAMLQASATTALLTMLRVIFLPTRPPEDVAAMDKNSKPRLTHSTAFCFGKTACGSNFNAFLGLFRARWAYRNLKCVRRSVKRCRRQNSRSDREQVARHSQRVSTTL